MPYVEATYYKNEMVMFLHDGVKHAKKSHLKKYYYLSIMILILLCETT